MSNPYFRFKQFTIQQDRCAMKLCTDSCILGAWTALRVKTAKSLLDIGTGTGVLSLMLAQKNGFFIDAIESDPESADQARENFQQSPWAVRLRIIHADVLLHVFESRYDFIITNPPFFESDLRSPKLKKNRAKHDESLTLDQLVSAISKNLRPDGAFSILLPFHRTDYFEKCAAASGFFLSEKLTVRQTPAHAPFRSICLFSAMKQPDIVLDEMIVKDEKGKYSEGFSRLMGEYY
jgi:tRNA1Val (adenine37-N6)-methyltransferase